MPQPPAHSRDPAVPILVLEEDGLGGIEQERPQSPGVHGRVAQDGEVDGNAVLLHAGQFSPRIGKTGHPEWAV